jgi:short-subunit dehydrogenase
MIVDVNLTGARVLVTGATGGIGRAIARAVAARGARPVLTGRRTDILEELAAAVGGRAVVADLTDRAGVEALVAAAGAVDVVIANAALPATGPLDSFGLDQLDRALDVNLRAPMVLARLTLGGMVERGHGHLVFVSSLAGKLATSPASIYSASKFGLRGFGLALREELRPAGVGVSTVFPGLIRDAGMFAETGVRPPRGLGTSSPEQVAGGVVRAIERNVAEVVVAPAAARWGALFGGLAPGLTAAVQRRMGAGRMVAEVGDRQLGKR